LGVAAAGDSLTSPPGRRVVFGASRFVRHTLSADGETLTFAAPTQLLRNWMVAIVLDLERDWTWDGLEDSGLTVLRGAPGDDEAAAVAVGSITIPRVLGPASTTKPLPEWRRRTRLVFLDAIDPHEPVPGTEFPKSLQHRWYVRPARRAPGPGGAPAPVSAAVEYADRALDLRLPIAIAPAQVPAIASVGLAFSPYVAGPGYASTEQRRRAVWIELERALENPVGRALFGRILAHGADPLLYGAQPEKVDDANPPLPIDPELVRDVTPLETDDRAGENAMTRLIPSTVSDRHFLLPLPPGLSEDDPELFGFYSYELRVGHSGPRGDLDWWSTANARFGAALRVVGVQHPPPPLVCHASRLRRHTPDGASLRPELLSAFAVDRHLVAERVLTDLPPMIADSPPMLTDRPPMIADSPPMLTDRPPMIADSPPMLTDRPPVISDEPPPVVEREPDLDLVLVTAPYATPVLDGRTLAGPQIPPRTSLWFFLYAQAVQADGASMRNILIATVRGRFLGRELMTEALFERLFAAQFRARHRDRIGVAIFQQAEIERYLRDLHLPAASPLSVLAAELLPAGTGADRVGHMAGYRHLDVAEMAVPADPGFPFGRVMRTSPLTPIQPIC
ncbi:MAG: hypothetical protein QOE11_2287, partial [Solirubrobacteraceae bacterium]|nr:hypothetical protein [Solirubrobacteraceae bacterium]